MFKHIKIFIIITFINSAYAQKFESISIRSGFTIANQKWHYKSINLTLDRDILFGLYNQFSGEFNFNKNINFRFDLGHFQKGHTAKINRISIDNPDGVGDIIKTKMIFNFLNVSPTVVFKFTENMWSPYFLFGLRSDYILPSKNLLDIDGNYVIKNKAYFGVTPGFGYQYKFKNYAIGSEILYLYDFSKMYDSEPTENNTGLSITNYTGAFNMFFKYYLKK